MASSRRTGRQAARPPARLRAQLLSLLREDPSFRREVGEILREVFPTAELAELKALREDFQRFAAEAVRRFEAIDQRFEAMDRRFEAMDRRFEAINERFEAMDRRFEAINERFEAMDRRFEAINERFEAMDRRFVEMREEMDQRFIDLRQELDQRFRDLLQEMDRRFLEARQESDRRFESILKELRMERLHLSRLAGRLGYGLEYLVRELVEEFAGKSLVRSERLVLQDRQGEVFGVPAEIEFDLFASDGEAYLCEVKSHIEPDDVLVFNRKADFAAKHIDRPFIRMMIGASMEKSAAQLMKSLRIESIVRAVVEEPPEPSS
jgi:hypothetical protein